VVQIKDNQKLLHREVKAACEHAQPVSTFTAPIEKARNRIEQREASVFIVNPYLIESRDWNRYIACVVQVKRYTEVKNTQTQQWEPRQETAYYAASHLHDAAWFADVIRGHWGTENRHHNVRDVALKEDASHIRKNPGIFARMRSFALNILRFNKVENIRGELSENSFSFENIMAYQGVN